MSLSLGGIDTTLIQNQRETLKIICFVSQMNFQISHHSSICFVMFHLEMGTISIASFSNVKLAHQIHIHRMFYQTQKSLLLLQLLQRSSCISLRV